MARRFVGSGFRLFALALSLVLLATMLAVWAPRLLGWEVYRFVGNSMEPTIGRGNLVIVKPVAWDEIGVGDIVTFHPPGYRVVTHRVVWIEGERLYTMGDANAVLDPMPVAPEWVIGRVVLQIPLGFFSR